MSDQDRPPTRFQSNPRKDGTIVVDTWNDGALIAFLSEAGRGSGLRDVPERSGEFGKAGQGGITEILAGTKVG